MLYDVVGSALWVDERNLSNPVPADEMLHSRGSFYPCRWHVGRDGMVTFVTNCVRLVQISKVIDSICPSLYLSIHLFPVTFELKFLWVMTLARLGMKVKAINQGLGLGKGYGWVLADGIMVCFHCHISCMLAQQGMQLGAVETCGSSRAQQVWAW